MPDEDKNKPSYMKPIWQTPVEEANETPERTEYVTPPTEEELAAENSYMKTPWNTQKPTTGMDELKAIAGDAAVPSPEVVQRRMRRARTAAMIGNLGNVMSAFANLYYVNKGAPSQKVPEAVLPDYMTFQDRVNQARRDAEAMKLQRERLLAQDEYHKGQLAIQEERNRINAEKSQAFSMYYKALEAKNNEQAAYWKTKAEALERGLPLDEALKQAKIAQAEAAAENSRASADQHRAQADVTRGGKTTSVSETRTDPYGNNYTVNRTTTTAPAGSGGGSSASSQGEKNNQGKRKVQTRQRL